MTLHNPFTCRVCLGFIAAALLVMTAFLSVGCTGPEVDLSAPRFAESAPRPGQDTAMFVALWEAGLDVTKPPRVVWIEDAECLNDWPQMPDPEGTCVEAANYYDEVIVVTVRPGETFRTFSLAQRFAHEVTHARWDGHPPWFMPTVDRAAKAIVGFAP